MKQLFLAKKSKRIFARAIDLAILLGSTCLIFFTLIYPFIFDKETFDNNSKEAISYYKESSLFLVDDEGNYSGKCTVANFLSIDDLYEKEVTYSNKTYTICLTKTLQDYYLNQYEYFVGNKNLSIGEYKKEVLKVGSETSNILSYDENTYKFSLIDETKSDITISYFLSTYESAAKNMISDSKINELTLENQKIMLGALVYIIPTLIGVSLITDLLIPLVTSNSKTIGKMIFHLGLVTKDGYKYPKSKLVIRYLSYILIEVILGFATFFGVMLISYTMFLFTKKRRCIHDFIAGSAVVDLDNSIIFANAKEEDYYLKRKSSNSEIYD